MLKLRFLLSPLLFPVYHVWYPFPFSPFQCFTLIRSYLLSMILLYTFYGILSMVFIFFCKIIEGSFHRPLFLFLFQIISAAKSGFIRLVYGCLYIQPTCAIRNCIISIAMHYRPFRQNRQGCLVFSCSSSQVQR